MVLVVAASPPDLKGKVVSIFASFTSGGGAQADDIDIPTGAPKIDLTVENPVLNVALMNVDTITNSINAGLSLQTKRGTNGDSNGEWHISDYETISIYHTDHENGVVMVTYIAAAVALT